MNSTIQQIQEEEQKGEKFIADKIKNLEKKKTDFLEEMEKEMHEEIEKDKAAGQIKITSAKEEATKIFKEKNQEFEKENGRIIQNAESKQSEATNMIVDTFLRSIK